MKESSLEKYPCIEAVDDTFINNLTEQIDMDFGAYDEEAELLGHFYLTESERLPFDSDGRIVIPQELLEYAGISGQIVFAGIGRKIRMWSPENFKAFSAEVKSRKATTRKRLNPFGRKGGA